MAERVKLTEAERNYLTAANDTFGYRETDRYELGRELKRRGYLYETCRAFYTTDAGRSALASQENDRG